VATAQREQRRARREVEQVLSRRRPELEQRAEVLLAGAPRLFREAASRPAADLPMVDPVAKDSVAKHSVAKHSVATDPVGERAIAARSGGIVPAEQDPLP
jgi:uncharacterized protein YdhG (YjbR/CyaY superfamily)